MTLNVAKSSRHESPHGVSPRSLLWQKFRRHRLARVSLWVLAVFYGVSVLAEFLAPFSADRTFARYSYAPPQTLFLFEHQEDGSSRFRPHVLGYTVTVNPLSLVRTFEPDPANKSYIRLLGRTEPYMLAGFIPMSRKLLAPADSSQPFFLLGADRLGRDLLSRTIFAGRVSLSVGLVGVALTLLIGVTIGAISGYFGGMIDNGIQRLIELLRSIPAIPLWLALTASLPSDWTPLARYFAVTLVLALIGWTEMARVVRSRFLSLRREDFVLAARLDGAGPVRTVITHMVPNFSSHLIAAASLAVPQMILAETALSFLGLGLQPPTVSWGVLLQEAQNVRTISLAPWLLIPGAAVVVSILAMNAVGDGLRDAADSYHGRGLVG